MLWKPRGGGHPGLTYHFHSNAYIGTVEMIDDNTILKPIIHHFHSNVYIITVEMIGDNTESVIVVLNSNSNNSNYFIS